MATVKQYAKNLWGVHKIVALKLGVDITWGSQEKRVMAISNDILLAGLIKVLTDNAVITDAQLNAVYNAITSAAFPVQPSEVPGNQDGTQAADPDIGV
jgi:hypothetical protein